MVKDDNYFMKKAYNEALKAYNKNEIPVGVVLVKNNKIISKAHNLKDSTNIVTKHAEIIAIEKANKYEKNWRLIDYKLYTTLEPCDMCSEVIKESKITSVIYAAKNLNSNSKLSKDNFHQINNEETIKLCEELIKYKFIELRKK